MHLSDEEAAVRAADRENVMSDYALRRRNNRILNAVVLAAIACVAAMYLIPHGGL